MVSILSLRRFFVLASLGFGLFGCGSSDAPSGGEANGGQSLAEPPLEVVHQTVPAQPASANPVADLAGVNFVNDVFDRSFLISPTVLSLKHFGGVTTTVAAERRVSSIRLVLEGRPASDAFPMINAWVETAGRRTDVLKAQVVKDKMDVSVPLDIAPGDVKVVIEYYGSTDPQKRPPLDIHRVVLQ